MTEVILTVYTVIWNFRFFPSSTNSYRWFDRNQSRR